MLQDGLGHIITAQDHAQKASKQLCRVGKSGKVFFFIFILFSFNNLGSQGVTPKVDHNGKILLTKVVRYASVIKKHNTPSLTQWENLLTKVVRYASVIKNHNTPGLTQWENLLTKVVRYASVKNNH